MRRSVFSFLSQRSLVAGVEVVICTILVRGALILLGSSAADAVEAPPETLSTQPTLVVKRFHFVGNTVFTEDELNKVVAKFVGRVVTSEDLEEARLALTRHYVDRGYINSGAILPDQTISDGNVSYQIIEGRLSDIQIQFLDEKGRPTRHLLRKQYVLSRAAVGSNGPLNLLKLKDQLELLRQDQNVKSINAELRPGAAPGQSSLDLQVRENNPFQIGLQFSNRRPPSVGESAVDLLVSDKDLTGNGDVLAVRYDIVNGPLDRIALAGGRDFSIDYALPITPYDTTVEFNFTRTDTTVGEAPFDQLGISSASDNYALTLRQPLIRRPVAEAGSDGHPASPATEFDVFLSGAMRDDRTNLLGQPFNFSSGAVNGYTRVWVVRLGQELNIRSRQEAFSARSVFSIGLPIFDATPTHRGEAGGRFVSWLGQAQYVRLLERLGPIPAHNWQFVVRVAAQVSSRRLVTLEQFALGGMDTVRGYRENQLVRDQGVVGSLEMHVPLIEHHEASTLDLVPFFDTGYGSDRGNGANGDTLCSLGLGFLFNPSRHLSAQLYYGVPLTSFKRSHDSAQDYGIHFNVTYLAF